MDGVWLWINHNYYNKVGRYTKSSEYKIIRPWLSTSLVFLRRHLLVKCVVYRHLSEFAKSSRMKIIQDSPFLASVAKMGVLLTCSWTSWVGCRCCSHITIRREASFNCGTGQWSSSESQDVVYCVNNRQLWLFIFHKEISKIPRGKTRFAFPTSHRASEFVLLPVKTFSSKVASFLDRFCLLI